MAAAGTATGRAQSGLLVRTGASPWGLIALAGIAFWLGYVLLFATSRRRPRSGPF